MATAAQPFLHRLVTCFNAPTAALSDGDGQIRATGGQGLLHADVRVLSGAVIGVAGSEPEPVAVSNGGPSGHVRFTAVVRALGQPGPDPTALFERWREVGPGTLDERLVLVNGGDEQVEADVTLDLSADLASVESVKSGRPVAAGSAPTVVRRGGVVRGWQGAGIDIDLFAPDAGIEEMADPTSPVRILITWHVRVPARAQSQIRWGLRAQDTNAVVVAAAGEPCWSRPVVVADDRRLAALLDRSLQDLAGLRMATRDHPRQEFCAAGAPWYFTLFGRDSLWAARMLLPLGTRLAADTLAVLAAYQGKRIDEHTGEAPGKIPHELRRKASSHNVIGSRDTMALPPLYYGTVDATPLWIVLLHEAWRWGMPPDDVRALLPALTAALGWLVDHADADGDGFIEYADDSGSGLANQGWKDSFDAIRFADGSLATGPIALCEVQGYAYQAALAGAALLEAFGVTGAEPLRQWAFELQERFRANFWVGSGAARRPALALDGAKRPVDSVTTNIGHLLGTGLLDHRESEIVARRVTAPDMRSGFGLRTMSALDGGYWPISYHCGSVWPHDTAIVLQGLSRAGFGDLAADVAGDLLGAGAHFDWRLPELFAGDRAADGAGPVPYPASCRPQAWSAAASVVLLQVLLGLEVDVPAGRLRIDPPGTSDVGALSVDGLVVNGTRVGVSLSSAGDVLELRGFDDLRLRVDALGSSIGGVRGLSIPRSPP